MGEEKREWELLLLEGLVLLLVPILLLLLLFSSSGLVDSFSWLSLFLGLPLLLLLVVIWVLRGLVVRAAGKEEDSDLEVVPVECLLFLCLLLLRSQSSG